MPASFLIIIALLLWLIPSVLLGGVEGQIKALELSGRTAREDQYLDDLYWTKILWETEQATVFNPVAVIVLVIGLLVMIYGVISKLGW